MNPNETKDQILDRYLVNRFDAYGMMHATPLVSDCPLSAHITFSDDTERQTIVCTSGLRHRTHAKVSANGGNGCELLFQVKGHLNQNHPELTWLIRWLFELSVFIAEEEIVIDEYAIFSDDEFDSPLSEKRAFSSMLAVTFPDDEPIVDPDGRHLVYSLFPLFPSEKSHLFSRGLNSLLDQFENAGVSRIINPDRPCAVSSPTG